MNQAGDASNDPCSPPFSEWAALFERNLESRSRREELLGRERSEAVRQQVLQAAVEYSTKLDTIAQDCGLDVAPMFDTDVEPSTLAVIATGHQPIVFHSGIVEKNLRLASLLATTSPPAIGLMIAIDTDVGDAGKMLYPSRSEKGTHAVGHDSISTAEGLYCLRRVASAEQVQNVGKTIQDSLLAEGFEHAAGRTTGVFALYERLAGQPISVANTIVRRHWEGKANYLELPLSRLVRLPAARQFMESIIRDGLALHETYNATIATYRATHKIRNKANPFPSLREDGQQIELPFWIVDEAAGTRAPLMVDINQVMLPLDDQQYIVPRGMMITTLLRLFVSDLFIHGTGGAKYDRCTDQFIEAYLSVTPPNFVAATRTRHLYQSQLAEVAETKAKFDHVRDVQKKFQKHVDAGTFAGEARGEAEQLISRRTQAIEDLKSAKAAGVSSADINKVLQAVDAEIKAFVQATLSPDDDLQLPSDDVLKVLETREFPFFFFDPVV